MPNWCHNIVEVKGKKEEVVRFLNDLIGKPQILRINAKNLKATSEEGVLVELEALRQENSECLTYCKIMPQPDNVLLGDEDWYDWRLEHWGVKWDIAELSVKDMLSVINDPINEDENEFHTCFDYSTPWAAPEEFFRFATLKYNVEILLSSAESGMCIYQIREIKEGVSSLILDTECELIWQYETGDSIPECLYYYLEPGLGELVAEDGDYDDITEALSTFFSFLKENDYATATEFNSIVKQVVNELEEDEKNRNLVLSRVLVELQEKVAISN